MNKKYFFLSDNGLNDNEKAVVYLIISIFSFLFDYIAIEYAGFNIITIFGLVYSLFGFICGMGLLIGNSDIIINRKEESKWLGMTRCGWV